MIALTAPAIVRTRFIRDPHGTAHSVAVEVIGTDMREIVPLDPAPRWGYHSAALLAVLGDGVDVTGKREHGYTSGQADVYWSVIPAA